MLRRAGVRAPILVLGGLVGQQIPAFLEHGLALTASSVDKLRAIDETAGRLGRRATVHLKVDTGMERIGVHWSRARKLFDTAAACPYVDVEGVFSHLANADASDLSDARVQLRAFESALDDARQAGLTFRYRHVANSGAVAQLPEANYDLVRPGLLVYGAYPSVECRRPIRLRPALSWRTEVVYFKVVEAGHPVSYGSTWMPAEWTRVVTLPVGYGDGYLRALSNRAEVVIRGARHRVVGRVCMDQVMVDIGRASAWNGDDVWLLSGDSDIAVSSRRWRRGRTPFRTRSSR
jgi:alanine racemase